MIELHIAYTWKVWEERFSQRHPSHCNPDASACPMNPFWRTVTVGLNSRVIISNRRPTEGEETVKEQWAGDMQHDALYQRWVRSNSPHGCLWELWQSTSTLRESFRLNCIFFADEIHCYHRSQIVREVRVIIPPLPACSQRSQIHRYQRGLTHHYQLAAIEATFTPTSEARSTTNSLLPAKPDCQRGESENSTTTSLLQAKPDCQGGESEHCTTTSLLPVKPEIHCCQWSQIHCYQLAHREARLSERWSVSMSEQWDKANRRLESEYVRVVWVSMSELLEWACQSG